MPDAKGELWVENVDRPPSSLSFIVSGLLLLILFSGCAPISRELRAQADRTLSFEQVFKNPEAVKGKIMIWGGEIIETINQKDGTTLIVVLQRPLDWKEEPKIQRSEGRFIILVGGYVDPYVFRMGRRISPSQEKSWEERPCASVNWIIPTLFFKFTSGENITTPLIHIRITHGVIMDTTVGGAIPIGRNASFKTAFTYKKREG